MNSTNSSKGNPVSSSNETRALKENELPKIKPLSKGTLQCFWKDEKPHFVFSFEESKLTATMFKSSSLSDYEYIFNSKGRNEEVLVGRMTVSSSFSSCSDHCKVLEREFVLISFGKVPNPTKRRTYSRFCGSVTLPNHWFDEEEPGSPSNHETVAIIATDHVYTSIDAGWGMKFLSKFNEPKCLSGRTVDVIVPAGSHGGPGSTGLVERWKSGGVCQCGGWDLGCPLTIFSGSLTKSISTFLDLPIQGAKKYESAMVAEIVGDGLYVVKYGPKFSGLQAFSVVVAHIHAQGRLPRPKMYKS